MAAAKCSQIIACMTLREGKYGSAGFLFHLKCVLLFINCIYCCLCKLLAFLFLVLCFFLLPFPPVQEPGHYCEWTFVLNFPSW